jgi:hypothetical protein
MCEGAAILFLACSLGSVSAASPDTSKCLHLKDTLSPRFLNVHPDVERELALYDTCGSAGVRSVAPSKILADYRADEMAADREYRDKPVLIKGTVDSVAKALDGASYLNVVAAPHGQGVLQLHFFKEELVGADRTMVLDDVLVRLSTGDEITAACIGEGLQQALPQFGECMISDVEKPKSGSLNSRVMQAQVSGLAAVSFDASSSPDTPSPRAH